MSAQQQRIVEWMSRLVLVLVPVLCGMMGWLVRSHVDVLIWRAETRASRYTLADAKVDQQAIHARIDTVSRDVASELNKISTAVARIEVAVLNLKEQASSGAGK